MAVNNKSIFGFIKHPLGKYYALLVMSLRMYPVQPIREGDLKYYEYTTQPIIGGDWSSQVYTTQPIRGGDWPSQVYTAQPIREVLDHHMYTRDSQNAPNAYFHLTLCVSLSLYLSCGGATIFYV